MSFVNVPTAHLPNPLKGGCQRKMKGSQAEQRERHLSFCSSFAFKEIKTEEKRDFFYFVLLFCTVHTGMWYLELASLNTFLPFTQCKTPN